MKGQRRKCQKDLGGARTMTMTGEQMPQMLRNKQATWGRWQEGHLCSARASLSPDEGEGMAGNRHVGGSLNGVRRER